MATGVVVSRVSPGMQVLAVGSATQQRRVVNLADGVAPSDAQLNRLLGER